MSIKCDEGDGSRDVGVLRRGNKVAGVVGGRKKEEGRRKKEEGGRNKEGECEVGEGRRREGIEKMVEEKKEENKKKE